MNTDNKKNPGPPAGHLVETPSERKKFSGKEEDMDTEQNTVGGSRSPAPYSADQGRHEAENPQNASWKNQTKGQKGVTWAVNQMPASSSNTGAAGDDDSASLEKSHTQTSSEMGNVEQPVPADGGSIKNRLRRKLEKSAPQAGCAASTTENKEDASLCRLTSSVETVYKYIRGKRGKGIHRPIQDAVNAIKLELHILKSIKSSRTVVPPYEEKPVSESEKSPPAKRLRADDCQEDGYFIQDDGEYPGATTQVLAALERMQDVLSEQWKVIEELSAQNRSMQEQMQRHFGLEDPGSNPASSSLASTKTVREDADERLPASTSTWTTVVGRKAKLKPAANKPPVRNKGSRQEKAKSRPNPVPRPRPPAIMVDVSREDFPELAKKIRSGVNKEVIGSHVVGMRQAKSGALLIEVRGDPAQVEAVKAEVSRSAGPDVGVKSLQQRGTFEIKDLDEWTTKEEIVDAVATCAGTQGSIIRVISLRKRYAGTQSAVVSADVGTVAKLIEAGRIRIGMVSCRVLLGDQIIKCFRCLSFGHMARACKGPDRSECCWRCGEKGHKVASCEASREVAEEFAKTMVIPRKPPLKIQASVSETRSLPP